jgi:hypothetical protein
MGQSHAAQAPREIVLVKRPRPFQVAAQRVGNASGQHGDAILRPLAITDRDLTACEVDVLDPQPAALEEAQPATVHQGSHQPGRAAKTTENGGHLGPREDLRNTHGPFGPDHVIEPLELALQHVAEQEQERAEGLVLGGGRDFVPYR